MIAPRATAGIWAMLALATGAGVAQAQEWSTSFTLYGFLPWADTEISRSGVGSVDSLATPGDVIDALEFTFMFAGEIRYGNFSLLHDTIYTELGSGGTLSGPFASTVNVDTRSLLATTALGYALYEDGRTLLQGFAGARVVDIETDVSLRGGGPIGIGVDAGVDKRWVDPVFGLRGRFAVSEKVTFGGFANVGGFGAGSDLTVDVFGGFDYAFSDRISANAGFRYIYIDYESSGTELELQLYGPLLGMTVRF